MKKLIKMFALSFILFVIVLSGCEDPAMKEVEQSACTSCAPPPPPPPPGDED